MFSIVIVNVYLTKIILVDITKGVNMNKKLLLFIIIIITSILDVNAQWESCNNGLNCRFVFTFTINENNIYVGTDKGVFVSTNNGENWLPINSGISDCYVHSLLQVSNTFFAGTYGKGIFSTTDNGNNWIPKNIGLNHLYITSLVQYKNKIFVGTDGGGVSFSLDSGKSWQQRNNGLLDFNINSLIILDNDILAGTYNDGIYSTKDNGSNWSLIFGKPKTYVESIFVSDNNIYVGTYDGMGVYLSTDNGISWIKKDTMVDKISISSITFFEGKVFAGTIKLLI